MLYMKLQNPRKETNSALHYMNCRNFLLGASGEWKGFKPYDVRVNSGRGAARYAFCFERGDIIPVIYTLNRGLYAEGFANGPVSPLFFQPEGENKVILQDSELAGLVPNLGLIRSKRKPEIQPSLSVYLSCLRNLSLNDYGAKSIIVFENSEGAAASFSPVEMAKYVFHYEQNNPEPCIAGARFEPLSGKWGGNESAGNIRFAGLGIGGL